MCSRTAAKAMIPSDILIVPTLCVGMQPGTQSIPSADAERGNDHTAVQICDNRQPAPLDD
jgi:hypothetical protein